MRALEARSPNNPLAGSPHMSWRESSSRHGISSRAFAESPPSQKLWPLVSVTPKSLRTEPRGGAWARKLLRGAIHFLSYHFIQDQRRTRKTRAAGFDLVVCPRIRAGF